MHLVSISRFRPMLVLIALMILPPGIRVALATDRSQQPNILIILVDDLGYGDLSSYGARDLQTPHIDRLVANGMRSDLFYANCPVCSPTRASLLTGRYPELVGVPGVIRTHANNSWGDLSDDAVLLPQLLAESGYQTAIVGKWHLGLTEPDRPTDRGFEFFHGFLGDMMDDYYTHLRHGRNYMRRDTVEIAPVGHATDLFSDWACEYLRLAATHDGPFFLYLAYNAPHTPIQPPEDWLQRVRQRNSSLSDQRAKLVALIEHLDAGIGRVVDQLTTSHLARDTLVVFTSDNGGQLNVGAQNGELRDGKQSMYEGGLRVPFAAVWPDRIQPGSRSHGSHVTMDIFPTICEAVGVEFEHAIDGVSMLPELLGQDAPPISRDLFFHRREGGTRYGGLIVNAIRRGDWKLLQNSPFAPQELYNLREDPGERVNLAERNKDKFRELAAALRAHVQRGGKVPWFPK